MLKWSFFLKVDNGAFILSIRNAQPKNIWFRNNLLLESYNPGIVLYTICLFLLPITLFGNLWTCTTEGREECKRF